LPEYLSLIQYFPVADYRNLSTVNQRLQIQRYYSRVYNIFFCGGEVTEDIQVHLRQTLEAIPNNKVPSSDTLLRELSKISTKNQTVISSSGNSYNINVNDKLLDLNIKSLQCLKLLKKGKSYDLDFGNQILEHEKYDAKKTYKRILDIFPALLQLAT
jgi:hypothetical protein